MTIFAPAIFSGPTHPVYRRLPAFGGRKARVRVTLLIIVLVIVGPLVTILTIVAGEAIG